MVLFFFGGEQDSKKLCEKESLKNLWKRLQKTEKMEETEDELNCSVSGGLSISQILIYVKLTLTMACCLSEPNSIKVLRQQQAHFHTRIRNVTKELISLF